MRENLAELKRLDNDVCEASKELCENTVISHGDLESKNVIWRDGIPYIIDWESAGFVHPVFDLVETAAYWASDTKGKLRGELFDAFVSSYMRRNKIENPNWRAALKKSFQSKLGWLKYSLKRSLGIESADEKDKETGTQHVFGTIKSINDHKENIKTILYTEGDNHGS